MAGDVDAEQVALVLEIFDGRERRTILELRIRGLLLAASHQVEEVALRARIVLRLLLGLLERVFNVVVKLRAIRLQRRERTCPRQVFKDALVDGV